MMLNAFDMVWPVGFHLAIPDLLEHWLFLPHFAWWKSSHKFLWCPSGCLVSRSLPAKNHWKQSRIKKTMTIMTIYIDYQRESGCLHLPFPARSPGQFLARQPKLPGRVACQKGSAPNRAAMGSPWSQPANWDALHRWQPVSDDAMFLIFFGEIT